MVNLAFLNQVDHDHFDRLSSDGLPDAGDGPFHGIPLLRVADVFSGGGEVVAVLRSEPRAELQRRPSAHQPAVHFNGEAV